MKQQVNRASNNRAGRVQRRDLSGTSARWQQRMLPHPTGRLVQAAALVLALVLILVSLTKQAHASPLLMVAGPDRAPTSDNQKNNNNNAVLAHQNQQQSMAQKQKPAFNNLENIISELLDDVGNRLKKNKLHSIKQTLRFGRSDPYMAPSSSDDDYEMLYDRQRELAFEDQAKN